MLRKFLIPGTFITTAGLLFFNIIHTGSGMDDTADAISDPADAMEAYRLVNDFADKNEDCLCCHGKLKYKLPGKEYKWEVMRHMSPAYRILREEYYKGNHKGIACFFCHTSDYETFPHSPEARLEKPRDCMDCHRNDEKYAHFRFDKIEEEYLKSVHHLANPDGFNCFKCHPHSYHISIRNTENLKATIAYDNSICLSCHADLDRYELLTDREDINIMQTHDWLPNQELHFQSVRCIECHTKINDSILVAHLVQPGEMAVRRCVECHSKNSILTATLYKFKAKEARNKYGFFNAVILNDAFVIGATRNYYLNLVSLVIFGLVFLGIGVHVLFRIIRKV